MNISLTPELEKFVQDKVNSGMYISASEVICESLRLLHTYDDLQTLSFIFKEKIEQKHHEKDDACSEENYDN